VGGGSNSAPPSDVAPGGGTYPTDAFGQAYNPSWYGAGSDYGVGSAIKTFGAGVAGSGQTPNFMTGSNFSAPAQISSGEATGPGLIPATGMTDEAAVMEMLKRLLGGLGGSGGGY
jgi:hypothetical protein